MFQKTRLLLFSHTSKNCSDVCLFNSELTVNHHQGLTIIKINEHVYVFGFQIANQTPNSWLTWLVQIRFLPLGNVVDFSLPLQTPPPPLCLLLPKFWISAIFSTHHYTAAKKKEKRKTSLCCVLAATVKGRALFLFRPTSFLAKLVRSLVASGLGLVLFFLFFFCFTPNSLHWLQL